MVNSKLQLAAIGHQDIHIIGNPQISFFKAVYKRHTNFMMEKKKVAFDRKVVFGNTNTALLESYGDLLYDMALVIRHDSLTVASGSQSSYANAIGHSAIDTVVFKIGGYTIDTQTGEWLQIMKETTTTEAQIANYDKMIGQNPIRGYHHLIGDPSGFFDEYLPFAQKNFNGGGTADLGENTIITPLRFWFCRNSYNALPVIALKAQQIEVEVKLKAFSKLYVTRNDAYSTWQAVAPTTPTIPEAYLLCDYIFLDEEEKRRFVLNDREYLITQVQLTEAVVNQATGSTVSSSNIKLNFTNPVSQLFWVIQRNDVSDYNEWFNYSRSLVSSGTPSNFSVANFLPPIKKAKLILNGKDRTLLLEENFYRRYESLRYAQRSPENFIYSYSFSINPENKKQPSGQINFSRITTAYLQLHYNMPAGVNMDVRVYALSYNIFKIMNKMGGVLYQQ